MEVVTAIVQPLATLLVFGSLFLVCLYGWFVSERAYRGRPTTFSWDPIPSEDEADPAQR